MSQNIEWTLEIDGDDVYLQGDGRDLVHIEVDPSGQGARLTVWQSLETDSAAAATCYVDLTYEDEPED